MLRQTQTGRIAVMAASTRAGSVNQALADSIAAEIDLANYPMPLYDADIEATDGLPESVAELAPHLRAVEVLVIVTPEYNGAFTPLLKNTVDWLTRADRRILAHLEVLLASASPGAGGGARAVAMTRTWMDNIGVAVAERTLSVGAAELGEDGGIIGLDRAAVADFAAGASFASTDRRRW